jgi:uncharacterized protein
MKIAIIGSGISGLASAYYLHKDHDISVFEANDYIGGHTHTHDIELAGKIWAIDTGFIVFNDWTYPNFIKLMDELKVPSQPSAMSFSVKCERTGIEYNGTTLNSLFAQRRNLLRPSFLRMIKDILRFNKEAPLWLEEGDDTTTLESYLKFHGYSQVFQDHYIIPMGAAIWSSGRSDMLAFPFRYFVRFFHNHGMLSVDERPVWRAIQGGSRSYLEPLTQGFHKKIRLSTPVDSIRRNGNGITIKPRGQEVEHFDAVVLACHSDQALALLADPTQAEQDILGTIRYQANEAILHTDASVLPNKRLAWAAWNYHIPQHHNELVALTYDMNILQDLDAPETFCVTLNYADAIDPARIIKRLVYHHPVYSRESITAQKKHGEISGVNRTYYAGAYWGFGFHEDGVNSALRVAEQIEGKVGHE